MSTRSVPVARLVVVDSPAVRSDAQNRLTRCVESIVPALGPDDRLVVLAGDRRRAQAATRGQRRAVVVDRTSAGLLDQLATLAGDRTVVVTEDHVLALHRRWLDDLTAPLLPGAGAAPTAVATVPATNGAAWPQCPIGVPTVDTPRRELRETARRLAEAAPTPWSIDTPAGPTVALAPGLAAQLAEAAHAASLHPTTVGALVAALPTLLAALPTLLAGDGQIRCTPAVYLHATDGVPLVSACLIMKDEVDNLEACLESIRPLVDEIVIHDTGSSDESVALARSLGATVFEGGWRDDFAWARNEALDRARGTWVLSIDLDERLEGQLGATPHVRSHLAADRTTDRFVLDLFNLEGSVHAPVRAERGLRMARLFRRLRCRWVDPIHEQPDRLPGAAPLRTDHLRNLWFVHHGYLQEIMRDRSKLARNLRVAMNEVGPLPTSTKGCFDVGRSLYMAGQKLQAIELFDRGLEIADNRITERACAQYRVLSLLDLGRLDDALDAAVALHAFTDAPGVARYLEGWIRVERGDWAEAMRLLDGLTDYNDNFTGFSEDRLRAARARALDGLGRRDEADAEAIAAIAANQQNATAWRMLLERPDGWDADAAGDTSGLASRLAAVLRRDGLVAVFAALSGATSTQQDQLADALFARFPEDRTVLAAVTRFAPSLPVERVLTWEGRLRRNALTSLAPVERLLADGTRPLGDRLLLAGAAVHRFEADDLRPELERLAAYLPDDDLGALLRRFLDEAPAAADSLVVATATTAPRSLELVAPLAERGHAEQALAVVEHAASLDRPATLALLAARRSLLGDLRRAAADLGRDDLGEVLAA